MKTNQEIDYYPLSSPQLDIWFDQMLYPDVPLYNIGGYMHIHGKIDLNVFEASVKLLVQNHDNLRTILVLDSDEIPKQTFLNELQADVTFLDLCGEENAHLSALIGDISK